jgi:inosine-uridine nucleoside N-ribohydrolase
MSSCRPDGRASHTGGAIEGKKEWPPHPRGDDLLRDVLSQAIKEDAPLALLIPCPLTRHSDLLGEDLATGIARLVWMGGAVRASDNLDPSTIPPEIANPGAEWNAYWDPSAVDWIFQNTSFPIVLFPQDGSKHRMFDWPRPRAST